MRLTKLILLLAALLLLLPGTALAEPQEQLFLRQVSVGSFDVWQHTDGRWQDTDHDGEVDPYGQTNKTLKSEVFSLPQTQYTSGFTVTRVKVEYDFTLTNEELKNTGRSEDWDLFYAKYLRKLPNNYSATKTAENLAQGTVTVQKTLDLMPKSLNLKDPAVREELGMSDRDFSDMAQGWRWYTPVLIELYGVPKAVVQPPDFSVKLQQNQFEMKTGQKLESTVEFSLNPDHPQPEKAVVFLFHVVGNTRWPVTLQAADPSNTLPSNGVIEFQPGEIKKYHFQLTAQNVKSSIQSYVVPVSVWDGEITRADWEALADFIDTQNRR